MSKKNNGIFCIEGEWESNLKDQSSIRPLVEFLANSDELIEPIYRRVATVESFKHFASQWKDYPKHSIGYFSFHGDKGALSLRKGERLDLRALGELLWGACKNKHIVLGSCKTLDVSPEELTNFRKDTGARSVSGYKKSPDWIESSAFDVILITNLLHHDSPAKTYAWLRNRCGGLMDAYGFTMSYQTRAMATPKR
jgi:hypothetical protein